MCLNAKNSESIVIAEPHVAVIFCLLFSEGVSLNLSCTVSEAILNRESGDSESCDSNRAIPRSL